MEPLEKLFDISFSADMIPQCRLQPPAWLCPYTQGDSSLILHTKGHQSIINIYF